MHGSEAYLDVVVRSATWEEHVEQIRELFSRLKVASLTVNLAKCEFGQAMVTYLGKILDHGQGFGPPWELGTLAMSGLESSLI
ncbi:hypothetical protein SRHO_G00036030 [Serrasalmus rhombeus]